MLVFGIGLNQGGAEGDARDRVRVRVRIRAGTMRRRDWTRKEKVPESALRAAGVFANAATRR